MSGDALPLVYLRARGSARTEGGRAEEGEGVGTAALLQPGLPLRQQQHGLERGDGVDVNRQQLRQHLAPNNNSADERSPWKFQPNTSVETLQWCPPPPNVPPRLRFPPP